MTGAFRRLCSEAGLLSIFAIARDPRSAPTAI